MPSCPHCYYALVLLEERHKYKCALCGKLYRQKDIEDKEFHQWNNWQRQLDLQRLEAERNDQRLWLRKQKKALRQLFRSSGYQQKVYYQKYKERRRRYWQAYYLKNREKELERYSKYYEANYQQKLLTHQRWLARNRMKRNEFLKAYRCQHLTVERQKLRLAYWRRQQKALAGAYLENSEYTPEEIRFFPFPPTSALCELLK